MRDRADSRKPRRRGFSLIELLIVIAIILVIVTIAVPQYNKQMMSAHETAAIQAIQTIHAVETQYYSQFGRYAVSLAELGPPASGAAGPAAADLISKDLTEGKKSGYIYTVAATPTGYAVSAVPEAFSSSGRQNLLTFRSNPNRAQQLVAGTSHRQQRRAQVAA